MRVRERELVHISWDRISWQCECRMWGTLRRAGERYIHSSFLPHSAKNRNAIVQAALWVCVGARVCVCECEKSEQDRVRVWIGMWVLLLKGVMQIRWVFVSLLTHTHTHTHTLSQLVSVLRCLGYTGRLAERRADGREVERPTQRPGAILQRPGLTIRPGHRSHQTAQQVRGVFLL